MERLEHHLEAITLVVALTVYTVFSAGLTFAASPGEASLKAAVQRTPLVVGLLFELHRGCLTLAVLAQLRQERNGYAERPGNRGSIDESAPFALLCKAADGPRHQHMD
jgi:hypothetical protein